MIPVIDLFAGPGGLGEGFSAYHTDGDNPFKIQLSIEKDPIAHSTLMLRAFIRQFENNMIPQEYYQYVRDPNADANELLYSNPNFKKESRNSAIEAQNLTLGPDNNKIEELIKKKLRGRKNWILIGGPPCQAYSVVGRVRMRNSDPDKFACDDRHTLYEHYLRMLARFKPTVFVMENVKGLLSSKLDGQSVFDRIRDDLSHPASALGEKVEGTPNYHIWSFSTEVNNPDELKPSDFITRSEEYGIPQRRHRVILLGIRDDKDISLDKEMILSRSEKAYSIENAIGGLPKIRSRLSKMDDFNKWLEAIRGTAARINGYGDTITDMISETADQFDSSVSSLGLGKQFLRRTLRRDKSPTFISDNWAWFHDEKLGGILNHEARAHKSSDLQRYIFCSTYAKVNRCSPKLTDFPDALLPDHSNVHRGKQGHFADRFRVQKRGIPSTTITSHISKDGHYYIHYDPSQCRSLTVREVARLQTFPDNYFFQGARTQQYHQVGNAVPPLLAKQLAAVVFTILKKRGDI